MRSRTDNQPRPADTFWTWLGAIMAVGLAIRVAFVLILQSRITELPGDAGWYHFQAKLLAQGRGFLNPVFFYDSGAIVPGADHPPGFVVLLAGLDVVGLSSTQAQRLALCLIGTVSILVIGLLGRRIGGPRTGLIAAALAAVYPNIWINDGMLLTETIFILATAVSLLFTYRYLASPRRSELAVVALALTVGALVRPEAMLLFALLVTPVVLTRTSHTWRERIIHLGLAALIPIVCWSPWIVYNLNRFEAPVLLSSGLGQTLLAGNCDATYSGPMLGYWDFSCLGDPIELDGGTADLSPMDAEYRRQALEHMRENRGELPRVVAARIGRVWGVFRPSQSIYLDGLVEGRAGGPIGTDLGVAREALWSYFVLAGAAVPGLVLLRRRRIPVYPLLAQAIMITLVAAMTFGLTRYRAGFEVSIVVLAAVAFSRLYTALGGPPEQTVQGPLDAGADVVEAPGERDSEPELVGSGNDG